MNKAIKFSHALHFPVQDSRTSGIRAGIWGQTEFQFQMQV